MTAIEPSTFDESQVYLYFSSEAAAPWHVIFKTYSLGFDFEAQCCTGPACFKSLTLTSAFFSTPHLFFPSVFVKSSR